MTPFRIWRVLRTCLSIYDFQYFFIISGRSKHFRLHGNAGCPKRFGQSFAYVQRQPIYAYITFIPFWSLQIKLRWFLSIASCNLNIPMRKLEKALSDLKRVVKFVRTVTKRKWMTSGVYTQGHEIVYDSPGLRVTPRPRLVLAKSARCFVLPGYAIGLWANNTAMLKL